MLQLGRINTLKILRHTSVGMYLGDETGKEVLLPNNQVRDDLHIDDVMDVFIYKDSDDRYIATTTVPKIKLHEFGFLNVKQTNPYGAFLDWGLEKDLLVPFKEQLYKMEEGKSYVVYVYLDEGTERLAASSQVFKFLDNGEIDVKIDDEVDLLIFAQTELGYKVVINNKYEGLIYENEVYERLEIGDALKGYIRIIRDDKRIDVRLQAPGYKNVEVNAMFILKYLETHDGFLNLHDGSSPDDILMRLQMSKKTFKKAIGGLYRQKLIRIAEDGIYLVK